MKKIILSLSVFLVVACGPTREELEARNKFIKDSTASVTEAVRLDSISMASFEEVKEEVPERQAYYNAIDFKLIPGTIVKWAPGDDAVIEEGFKNDKFFKCWVHIQQIDGSVKVMPVDEFTWHNLYTGDVLK